MATTAQQVATLTATVKALTARLVKAEADLAALKARPDIKVAAVEPAHDGSQRDRDLWVAQ